MQAVTKYQPVRKRNTEQPFKRLLVCYIETGTSHETCDLVSLLMMMMMMVVVVVVVMMMMVMIMVVVFFFIYFNQQSVYEVFYKLMGWLGV